MRDYCSEIARSSGIDLSPEAAFQWLGSGGFANDMISEEKSTAFGFLSAKGVVGRFTGVLADWEVSKNNCFEINLEGSTLEPFAVYQNGRVFAAKSYRRNHKVLPLLGHNQVIVELVNREKDATRLAKHFWGYLLANPKDFPNPKDGFRGMLEVLEALISDGWVKATFREGRPLLQIRKEDSSDEKHEVSA